MYQLLKVHIDGSDWKTWETISRLSPQSRKEWIKNHIEEILQTIDKISQSDLDGIKACNLIGFETLNDNLYKEGEAIYDSLFRKLKNKVITSISPAYYRGISRFLQGRFKEAYEDFKISREWELKSRGESISSTRAITYMEETIFPTREIIKKNNDRLSKDISGHRELEYKFGANILRTIHKWNSSSPLFSRGISQGGGYFLSIRNPHGEVKGIAIDPGYDFLDIFWSIGLSIADLDAVIMTHDHDDHTESLEGILSLLAKYNDHNLEKKSKVLDLFGSPGVLLKFHGLLSATDPYGNKEINFKLMTPGSKITDTGKPSLKDKYGLLSIDVFAAYHNELWTNQESSLSLVLKTCIKTETDETLNIGITGDSRYESGIGSNFTECQIILINIGSVEKEEGKLLSQHLGMLGCINLLKVARLNKPLLAVLTEFGEELAGKRGVISRIIENWSNPINTSKQNPNFRVIPADINLEIKLQELSIRDSDTNIFFPYQSIIVNEPNNDIIKYLFKSF